MILIAARPGVFYQRDRAKWDAWKAVEGTKISLHFYCWAVNESVVGSSQLLFTGISCYLL